MLRRLLIFAVVAPLAAFAVCLLLTSSNRVSSNPDLPLGDFWRLPWRAGASRNILSGINGGNGYGENTHAAGLDYWALDFQVPEGQYVMATTEGTVIYSEVEEDCGPGLHYGTFLQIKDPSGFVHLYGHLQEAYFSQNEPGNPDDDDYVMPGWVIGKSGHTGHSVPCSGAHLHFRITEPGCTEGRCIPEPLSDQCADWTYKGYDLWCGLQGDEYAFSHGPSYVDDPWKDNYHLSNNAGVGDYPVVEGQPITYDAAIQARYVDEGNYYGDWSSLVVGKPVDPTGAGWYVHRWDSYPLYTGVLQDLDRVGEDDIDSPDPTFGGGAIMHGDYVVHDPVDGRADIPAMWVFGDFWWKYVSYCQGIQYIHYLGYPKTEQYEFDYGEFHFWWQRFENGYIFKSDADNEVYVRNPQGEPFGPACDETDSDGDLISDDDEVEIYGTDPLNPDTDGDGCTEGYEVSIGFAPLNPWDVYDVPVPAVADPTPNGPRNRKIDMSDVLAVLFYAFARDNQVPNGNGVDYDSWKDGDWTGPTVMYPDAVLDILDDTGRRYDRSPGEPPTPQELDPAGPPNGVVDMTDVLAALAQAIAINCTGGGLGGPAGPDSGLGREGTTSLGPNAMAVDAMPGGAVDSARTIKGAGPFDIDIAITAAKHPYAGYQFVLSYDDRVLALLPTADVDRDGTPESWAYGRLDGATLDAKVVQRDLDRDSVVDQAAGGSALLFGPTSATGVVATVRFQCVGNGTSPIYLVAPGEGTFGTGTLASGGAAIGTGLEDAAITCSVN